MLNHHLNLLVFLPDPQNARMCTKSLYVYRNYIRTLQLLPDLYRLLDIFALMCDLSRISNVLTPLNVTKMHGHEHVLNISIVQ